VQAYPRYLEQRVVLEFQRTSRNLELVRFTHVAGLVWVGAMYAVGLAPRASMVPEDANGLDVLHTDRPKSPRVSRAYAKLQEALARSGWSAEVAAADPPLGLGVDVGAAPGGWSCCLAASWRCSEVLAVDPAELDAGLLTSNAAAADAGRQGRIRHCVVKWQEAVAELVANSRVVDVLVCDANISCDETMDMLEAVARCLAMRAFVVLTFKNTCKTKQDFEALKAQQLQRLRALCTDVREVQLLANRKETTVLGRFSGRGSHVEDTPS